MTVLVVDYGMCNLGSVRRAFEECGTHVIVTEDPDDLAKAHRIVIPGVGAFSDGMENLRGRGWPDALREAVLRDRKPTLGICLGMHLLASRGYEGGTVEGLGLVQGEVVRLVSDQPSTKIPHVGWNEVWQLRPHSLFKGIPDGMDFYFVHGYHFRPTHASDALGTTPYCGSIIAALAKDNVLGVQFHPEKSSRSGFQLLRNFLAV